MPKDAHALPRPIITRSSTL